MASQIQHDTARLLDDVFGSIDQDTRERVAKILTTARSEYIENVSKVIEPHRVAERADLVQGIAAWAMTELYGLLRAKPGREPVVNNATLVAGENPNGPSADHYRIHTFDDTALRVEAMRAAQKIPAQGGVPAARQLQGNADKLYEWLRGLA